MKKFLYPIVAISCVITTLFFIACSNDFNNYQVVNNTRGCCYEYIYINKEMSPEVKLKNIRNAEQRILDNIEIIDGKISLSHTSAEELRIEKGVGQVELAKEINVSKGIISLWENGLREPKLSNLIVLAQFFGVSIDYLAGLEN